MCVSKLCKKNRKTKIRRIRCVSRVLSLLPCFRLNLACSWALFDPKSKPRAPSVATDQAFAFKVLPQCHHPGPKIFHVEAGHGRFVGTRPSLTACVERLQTGCCAAGQKKGMIGLWPRVAEAADCWGQLEFRTRHWQHQQCCAAFRVGDEVSGHNNIASTTSTLTHLPTPQAAARYGCDRLKKQG